MLQLEALQANDGDCLLLHYDDIGGQRGLILIDGGSAGVYRDFLKTRLDELRGNSRVLNLRLVVVSHNDADHITGILDMFRQMSIATDDSRQPPWSVASLWHNSFEKVVGKHAPSAQSATVVAAANGNFGEQEIGHLVDKGLTDMQAQAVVASVKQGKDLRSFAAKLTKINAETNGNLVMAPESGAKQIKISKTLTFTILGPHETELNKLEKEWNKSKAAHPLDEKAAAAEYLNQTVPNVSSIVFLAEQTSANGKTTRMLLTGDARGDVIIEGLETAGLLDANKRIKVDLLKVQHHGSNHSVTEDFFSRVIADTYVISGNGKHGIPHMDTLRWLSNARKDEAIDVYMTNRELSDKGVDLTPGLTAFLKSEESRSMHRYHFRQDHELYITVALPQGEEHIQQLQEFEVPIPVAAYGTGIVQTCGEGSTATVTILEERHINACIEDGEPPLEKGCTYRFTINVGKLCEHAIATTRLRDFDWKNNNELDVWIVLSGDGFVSKPRQQKFTLPKRGDTDPIVFALTPTRYGSVLLRISLYFARELTLLQEFEVPIPVKEVVQVA